MSGRVAFITGVSRGIGAALAELLQTEGFDVFGCSTSANWPTGVTGTVCDVSSDTDVAAMFAEFGERSSRLDLLINNAGLLGPRTELENIDAATWRRVFEVNADGPFHVCKYALPYLRAAGGRVVNVSSSVGRVGRGTWGAYACSKHALEGMTDVLAEELHADGIIVLSMNPGGTATDMRASAFPDEDPATLPTAAEIARTIIDQALGAKLSDSGAKLNCRDFLGGVLG